MALNAGTKLCLVIGDPVAHSLSPLIHNAAYKFCGLADKFVFLAARVAKEDLKSAVSGIRSLGVRGVSCTIPHKQAVMAELDEIEPAARRIGAVNTVVNENEQLLGCNTDVDGVVEPLSKRTSLRDKRVLVIGAGGAARAAVFGLSAAGAVVTVLNRTAEKGRALAEEAGADFLSWEAMSAARDYDIIFNATPAGMGALKGVSPLEGCEFRPSQIVFDAIYNPFETKLLQDAARAGAEVIRGTEMFIEQAARQFLLYTGMEAPRPQIEQVLLQHFGSEAS